MTDAPAPVRRRGALPSRWTAGACALCLLAILPVAAVLSRLLDPTDGAWSHILSTTLPLYLGNSLVIAAGTVALAVAIGAPAAWFVAAYEFPGRRVLEWALILPMTAPGFVVAVVYFDLLTYAGPVQGALRDAFGWERGDYWFPPIASRAGAVFALGFVSYPYVYLLTRAAFLAQPRRMMDAARSLGAGPVGTFRRVALPLARPAIAAGAGFVAMETLADFGAVTHLGQPTLTTGIYRAWFSAGSPPAAARLAALLLGLVILAIAFERIARGGRRFAETGGARGGPMPRLRLGGRAALIAFLACAAPVAVGFGAPVARLLWLHFRGGDPMWGARFLGFALTSLGLAASAALLVVGLGLFLAYARRLDDGPAARLAVGAAGLGYAVPGSVVAVGLLIALGGADRAIDGAAREFFGVSTGLLLTGTVVALLYAYSVRFAAVALHSLEAGLARVSPSLDAAARSLGSGPAASLRRVHAPLVGPSALAAAIFVFADVMKELPATLIVRPFNFDTLAVRVFRLAADARIEEASTASLAIVLAGIGPVILMSRALDASRGRAGD